ncbi:MAG: class I SAM-dependent methyltransferase [Candidatus Pacearchaeota archaeon]|nr:class I SAM-dependent methyltransferase [Candidatus Pacearchaeota archaeon]
MGKFERAYFEGKTSAYKGGYAKADALIHSRLELVKEYKKKGKLLDVGCAYGFFLQEAKKNFVCYGFDTSEYAIKKARKITKANLSVASAERRWPYTNNFFDIITMWGVLEHLKNPKKGIKEARRCIKKGGYLFVQTPNKFVRNLIGDKDKTHISKKNIASWIKLFKANGFKIVEHYTEFPRFIGKKNWINKTLKIFRLPLGTNIKFVLKKEK